MWQTTLARSDCLPVDSDSVFFGGLKNKLPRERVMCMSSGSGGRLLSDDAGMRCNVAAKGSPERPLEETVCARRWALTPGSSPGAGSQRSCPDIWLLGSGSWHSPPGPGSVWPGSCHSGSGSCHRSSPRSSDRSRHCVRQSGSSLGDPG